MPASRLKTTTLFILLSAFTSYSLFLYANLPVKPAMINKEADNAKLVWQKYNCNACHQVYGLGGYLGPDLTNVYTQRGEEYVQAFLKTGTGTMPKFHLSENETRALLVFMKEMDASGKADPKTFSLKYDGTIEQ